MFQKKYTLSSHSAAESALNSTTFLFLLRSSVCDSLCNILCSVSFVTGQYVVEQVR